MDEKCDPLGESLDEAFSTLSLVNAPDMDVFMKAIMLMDEKEAQSLRGELNHVMCKHLDSDAKLRQKIIDNKYENFNIRYIKEMYSKIGNAKVEVYRDSMKKSIIAIIDLCETPDQFIRIMTDYVENAPSILSDNLTPGIATIDFMNKCCKYSKESIKHLINIHSSIYQIYCMKRCGATRDRLVDSCRLSAMRHLDSRLTGIAVSLYEEFSNNYLRIEILLSEMKHEMSQQLIAQYGNPTLIYSSRPILAGRINWSSVNNYSV